ncbi:MAG: hypothetical protein H6605_07870 [Flavobacteriales bacterium]|nr:hypothetical protein [Flavobacteriales bacterium]
MNLTLRNILYFLLLIPGILSCSKKESIVIPDNVPENYDEVSTVKIENYINRLYIDLLGREPLVTEKERDVKILKDAQLSYDSRRQIITTLMTDSSYRDGDSSYKKAYYQRMYEQTKARLVEGAEDGEFSRYIGNAGFALKSARLLGDSIGVFSALTVINRCQNVLDSRIKYQTGQIDIAEMYTYMLDNPVYDVINMNSLNFVNASFDDLFFRFPTKDEFKIAYDIIESGTGGSLFGGYATNKAEYCRILVDSREFYEGMIKWCYVTLIGRDPTTQESFNLIQNYYNDKNLQEVQTLILMTDEYAHF